MIESMNFLGELEKGRLNNSFLVFYGRIRCLVKAPRMVASLLTPENGGYAILDVFALKENINSQNATSLSIVGPRTIRGDILIYIDNANLVGKYVKVGGKSVNAGVKVRQQKYHTQPNEGITALVFKGKVGKDWEISANACVELGEKDEMSKNYELWDTIIHNMVSDTGLTDANFPEELKSYQEFHAITDYEEISTGSVKSVVYHKNNGERIDVSKIDLHLTNHDTGIVYPSYCNDIKDEIEEQSKKRSAYAKSLYTELTSNAAKEEDKLHSVAEKIRDSFVDNVVWKMSEKIGNVKGRVYLDAFFKNLEISSFIHQEDEESGDALTEKAREELKAKVVENPDMLKGGYEEMGGRINNVIDFAISVIGLSTGIGYDGLKRNYSAAAREFRLDVIPWFHALLTNPYKLVILGSGIDFYDADIIYYSYSKRFWGTNINDADVKATREELVYLQLLESCTKGDSIIKLPVYKDCISQYSYGKRKEGYLRDNGFPLGKDLTLLLGVICGRVAMSYSESTELLKPYRYKRSVVDTLIDRGLMDLVGDDELMLERDLEKEFLIFQVFQELGNKRTQISDETIDWAIKTFEEKVGFELSEEQKQGVNLIKYRGAVLSGCAGSGKTTTSDCMKIALETLEGYKMVYCTPTGKAARRLAEVTGANVKTIHSEMKIGVGASESYLKRIAKKPKTKSEMAEDAEDGIRGRIYLIDEAGMINRDILYEVARNVKDTDYVYFLGDIKQLPPIVSGGSANIQGISRDGGSPLYYLMQILPCVELGVSKRAAEGSLVNYNTTLINCCSDGAVEELAFDDSTFIATECSDMQLPQAVVKSVEGWMNGTKDGTKRDEKDIFVISGYASNKYSYSSTRLNPLLQASVRAKDTLLFSTKDNQFYRHDRVIHVSSNLYGMPRWIDCGNNEYEEVLSMGVINGELGEVVGVVNSERCEFYPLGDDYDTIEQERPGLYGNVSEEMLKDLKKNRDTYASSSIDFDSLKDGNCYFVKVKVFDVYLRRDVIIFYYGYSTSVKGSDDSVLTLSSVSLENLELAYALTCHKMQGSQSQVVIIPFGSDANPEFINRNMINTMITRSQGIVELIGTVSGPDSVLNRGRQCKSKFQTNCLLDVIVNEANKEG